MEHKETNTLTMFRSWRGFFSVFFFLLFFSLSHPVFVQAQFRTDRLLISGQIAYDNQDYVVAMQHFNHVLSGKPYLYQPWYYRGLCKLQLDDFVGAESDFNKAIELNPYIHQIFSARAESRIRQQKYAEAIEDYDRALKLYPDQKGYWYNRAYCRFYMKDLKQTHEDLEYIVKRWPDLNNAYSLQTEAYLSENDTVMASRWLDKTLEHNPYDGNAWSIRARLNMQRKNWREADEAFTKAIHYQPRVVNHYMYRAMTRVNLNKLRQAMEDYDKAIDMDPNNFLSHYNRGLLRQQLGDDNRAIEDFNFVLRYEPNNIQALYNRALLLDKTGNYRAAIIDYSRVIEKFPNFWAGLMSRAACYRKLGMTAQAELDEFRVLKAQMDKHLGIQQRWSKNKLREVRKMSDIDVEKYDQWVVVDEDIVTPQFKNDYRGAVQNRNVNNELLPMFLLSFMPYQGGMNTYHIIVNELEDFNNSHHPLRKIYVTCRPASISEEMTNAFFQTIDSLTAAIGASRDVNKAASLLLQRAVAHSTTHNFAEAMNDLDDYLVIDSTSMLVQWQRAVCGVMMSELDGQPAAEEQLKIARAADDLRKALAMSPDNAYLLYNQATMLSLQKNYARAIDLFGEAIRHNPNLPEAYYNRGLTRILAGQKNEGLKDLSQAGELGLYDAYSVMKRYTNDKK